VTIRRQTVGFNAWIEGSGCEMRSRFDAWSYMCVVNDFGFIYCMGSEAIRHKTGEGLYKYGVE
jgi:hypothetical protein